MYQSKTKIRVRYGETDQMGYVYYGNYAQYFEVGRVEALRELGMSYKEMEDRGIMLPVHEYTIKYLKPAFYDDELTITTRIREMPRARIFFDYEVHNENGDLLNKASTTLVFIDKDEKRPVPCPEEFRKKLKIYFEE